ncbi:MAG: tRNA dihydrouridine synthase DusB [Candidatus Krumholzibacteria bacterium]|nr:tRNA dihydrouridine synthase DusB [Candidatus Krumholzibacteria bacterium]
MNRPPFRDIPWARPGAIGLAPLAGYSDPPMRLLCFEYGADFAVTEMVSAEGLVRGGEATRRLLDRLPGEGPVGVQLFGADPGALAEAARIAAETGPGFIDLNFGCPVRKVIRQGAGAALMRDVGLISRIAGAVVAAVPLPVTAKIRSGWSEAEEAFIEAGRALEEAGCSAVTLHPRYRTQQFGGTADWSHLARLRAALSIPVIASGDVTDLGSYRRIIGITGCEIVMIGRGAFGRPWIFGDIREGLAGGVEPLRPLRERAAAIVRLARMERAWKGERQAVVEMRKHYRWFLRGIPGARDYRARLAGAETLGEVEAVIGELAAETE